MARSNGNSVTGAPLPSSLPARVTLGKRESLFMTKSANELLAEFCQSGRQEPFEEIVRRYAGMVYNVSFRVTNNAHDAEDATQAVFLSLALQAKTNR